MKRPFRVLLAVGLALIVLAATAWVASADWGDDDQRLLPSRESGSGDPRVASIELRHCKKDAVASWKKTNLTYRVVNVNGVDAKRLDAVRAGLNTWNNVNAPYKLREVTTGTADVTVQVQWKLLPGNVLGQTNVSCLRDLSGIASASITLYVDGITQIGLRNIAGHEMGHALGLGHSDKSSDLMYARFDLVFDGLTQICPSNLDVGGLRSKVDPYKIPAASLSAPKSC